MSWPGGGYGPRVTSSGRAGDSEQGTSGEGDSGQGGSGQGGSGRVEATVQVAASPETVWALVSDLPGMGRFSPEATGGRWVRGDGPVPGAVFRGTNASGRRRWSTRATVVEAEPGRSFVFDVSSAGLPVARWAYRLEPVDGGCCVTESWEDRRGAVVALVGRLLTGTADREAFTATSIARTLQQVKVYAE